MPTPDPSPSPIMGYVLDTSSHDSGPGAVYVLDARTKSPTFAERLAGPFANEHAALRWIDDHGAVCLGAI